MKLTKVVPIRTTKIIPSISVTPKGKMKINQAAAVALDIKPGDTINYYQDENSPTDWYIKKETGGRVTARSAGRESKSVICNSVDISNRILRSIKGFGRKSVNMRISTTPIEGNYYAIITSSAKL